MSSTRGVVSQAQAVLAGLLAVAGCADDGGPRLEAVTPAAAPRETIVLLTGRRLCGLHGDCARAAGEIQLGWESPIVRARVVSYADTVTEIAIPSLAQVGPSVLIVTVDERSSNALAFEVLP